MKIQFLIDYEFEMVTGMEEDGETPITEYFEFKKGEEVEVEGIDHNKQWNTANIYFSDGRSVYGVPTMVFEVSDIDITE